MLLLLLLFVVVVGSREHAIEFLGTGELNRSEFKGTSLLILGEQGRNANFCG